MTGNPAKNPSRWWAFLCGGDKHSNSSVVEPESDISVMNFSDTVFEFLDDSGPTAEIAGISGGYDEIEETQNEVEEMEQNNDNVGGVVEDDKVFWENQLNLLQSTLFRTSSIESRIRNLTHEALQELQISSNFCCCHRPAATDVCRNCLMTEICNRLINAGFNCALSKSKWTKSSGFQTGEHIFLDVIDDAVNPKTGKSKMEVIIIELNFRGEFEMAKGSEEYNQLIQKLPEVFVGKIHRLESSIKILCLAAKKCMKDKNMHLGPWRKKKYMKAKWLGPCERITPVMATVTPLSDRTNMGRKLPMASLLTVDLMKHLPKCNI